MEKDRTKQMYEIVKNLKRETAKMNRICGDVLESYCNGTIDPCPFRCGKDCTLASFTDDVERL